MGRAIAFGCSAIAFGCSGRVVSLRSIWMAARDGVRRNIGCVFTVFKTLKVMDL